MLKFWFFWRMITINHFGWFFFSWNLQNLKIFACDVVWRYRGVKLGVLANLIVKFSLIKKKKFGRVNYPEYPSLELRPCPLSTVPTSIPMVIPCLISFLAFVIKLLLKRIRMKLSAYDYYTTPTISTNNCLRKNCYYYKIQSFQVEKC